MKCSTKGAALRKEPQHLATLTNIWMTCLMSNVWDQTQDCYSGSSHKKVFLVKGILKICSKFTTEHPCWSTISIKWYCNFIKITLRHGCSPVSLLHIFRTPFPKSTSEQLLLLFFEHSTKVLVVFPILLIVMLESHLPEYFYQTFIFRVHSFWKSCCLLLAALSVNIEQFLRTSIWKISANGCFCISDLKVDNKYWASADLLFLMKNVMWDGFC